MTDIPQRKKINLALQGGGAHGAYTWGVVDWLLQDNRLEIDSISASSAGAMNAVVIAQGLTNDGPEGARKALYHFWRGVSEYGEYLDPVKLTLLEKLLGITIDHALSYRMFDFLVKAFSPYQLNPFNYRPLKDFLESIVDFEQIRSTEQHKLFISATNVQTGKIKIFSNKELTVDCILASTCLPYLFQTVEIDGEYYWNGGYMGNPAIFPLIYNSDVRDILIININPLVRETIPKTASEITNRINEISFNSSLMREMRAVAFVTKMIENHWIKEEHRHKLKKMNMHVIRNDGMMTNFSVASKLNTDWEFLSELYEKGRTAGKEWLEVHYDKIGNESSVDFDEYV